MRLSRILRIVQTEVSVICRSEAELDLDKYEIYFVCAEIRIIIGRLLMRIQEYNTMNNNRHY